LSWWNLPNAITLGRIVLGVLLAPLILYDSFAVRLLAFVVFLAAAISDVVDGNLARSRNLITDFGKLADPLADKLLLVSTFVPFYLLSHGWEPETPFPWFGGILPLWVLVVIFGRELFITVFRGWAARRGIVLAAGLPGKMKAAFQATACGAIIFWYALRSAAREHGWHTRFWDGFWVAFHRWFCILSLGVAVVLTVWSLWIYLHGFRAMDLRRRAPT
jgi:CDP-diacylglycerol--glycerol-3-phosphate 3-phosphatidyltransferase